MDESVTSIEKMARGLLIIAKYPRATTCAEHDKLMAGADAEMSPEDKAELESLGWFEDEGGWAVFT